MANQEDLNIQPGFIQINSLLLTSTQSGQKIDISTIVEEFSLYENVIQPYMTADFVIGDSTSLFTLFPVTGDEYIDIDYEIPHPAFKKKVQQRYRVVSIQDVSPTSKVRHVKYILRCTLNEAYKDWTTKIRKAYQNMITSDMAKQLSETFLGLKEVHESDIQYNTSANTVAGLTSTKADGVIISPTFGTRTIVIPNYTPTDALKFIARESKSANTNCISSNYAFYSTPDAYWFTTIEEKLGIEPTDKYFVTEKNYFPSEAPSCPSPGIMGSLTIGGIQDLYTGFTPNKPFEFMKINSYKFLNIFDLENNLRQGAFDATTYVIDPTVSKFSKQTYNYAADYDKFQRTDSKKKKFVYADSPLTQLQGASHERFIMSDKDGNQQTPDRKYEFLHYLAASVAMLDYVAVEMSVPGDPTRHVGDIIRLGIPEYSAFDETIGEENAFLSGDYFVASVRHYYSRWNGKGYQCVMQCLKNCYNKSPEESKKELSTTASTSTTETPVGP